MRDIPVLPPDLFDEQPGLDATADGLLAAATQGSARAFEEFYNTTIRQLMPGVRRICGDAYAEDVLADTYFQVWQSLHTYDSVRGGALVWLRMIASSRARDRARRERVRHGGLSGAMDYDPDMTVCAQPGPADLAETRQEHERLHAALTGFPARERTVLRMYMDDCTHDEISVAMGMPVGTVKTVILRSRARLRGIISAPRPLPSHDQPSFAAG